MSDTINNSLITKAEESLNTIGVSLQTIKTYAIIFCVVIILCSLCSSGLSFLKVVYGFTLK